MAAIAGVWNLDGRPIDPEILERIGATLTHRVHDGAFVHLDGPVGLWAGMTRITPEAATEVQPLVDPSGISLVFHGRLDEREAVVRELGLPPDRPDPEVTLAAYRRWGDRFPERLLGDFAWAVHDRAEQVLLLGRDAMGMRPLFVYRSASLVVFASEAKAVLAHPDVVAAPDEEELATYVLNGTMTGTRHTLFRGIERVMPSHIDRITRSSASTRRYWDFDPMRRIRLASFEDYADGFREVLQTAVRRRLRSAPPIAISLSGGLDSTSIFVSAEMIRRGDPDRYPRIIPITFSSQDGTVADEMRYVEEIRDRYGVDVLAVPPSTVKPTARVRDVVWMAEVPGTETFWDCMLEVHRRAGDEGARTLMSGHLGDQMLFDRAYLVDLFDQLRWPTIARHIREYPRWNLEGDTSPLQHEIYRRLLRDHMPAWALPAARRAKSRVATPLWDRPWFTERFRRLGSGPVSSQSIVRWQFSSAHAHAIYWQARGPSAVQTVEGCDRAWAARGLELSWPYADRDLLAYLMAIPGEMQSHDGVPRAILREAMRDVIPDSVRVRRWKASFGPMIDAAVDADREDLLAAAARFTAVCELGYVDEEELRRAVEEVPIDGRTASGLNNTLALEAWASVFLPRPSGAGLPRSDDVA